MTTLTSQRYPDLPGNVWLPAKSKSFAGRPMKPVKMDVFITVLRRPRWSQKGLFTLPSILNPKQGELEACLAPYRKEYDPELFCLDPVWLDVGTNERVDKGGEINITRLFGAVSGASTANGVITAIAIASANITVAHGDLSLGSGSASVTTNEFTTIGLSRATGTIQNFVGTTVLDATVSVDIFKSFSISGSGTAYGSGLFDQVTVAGSFLFVEKLYASTAVVQSGDTLNNTTTITL